MLLHPPYSPAHSSSFSALSVASWKLQQGTCKSDRPGPANICLQRWPPWFRKCSQLSWATKSQQYFALHPRPSRIRSSCSKTLLETSLITPRLQTNLGLLPVHAVRTFHPALLLTLPCTPSQVTQSLRKHDHLHKAELKWQQKSPHSGLLPSQSTAQGQEYKHRLIC